MKERKKQTFLLLPVMLVFWLSCNSNKQAETTNSLDFTAIQDKFKYENLKQFSLDTLGWGKKRFDLYKHLDSNSFVKIYQDTTERFEESGGMGNADYFYSKQKSKRNLIELTLLVQREGDYIDRIEYFIYTKGGKKISSFVVASGGGDGGYYETAEGKFLNDSTYLLSREDNYDGSELDQQGESITRSEIKTIIKQDGTIFQTTRIVKKETKNPPPVNDTIVNEMEHIVKNDSTLN